MLILNIVKRRNIWIKNYYCHLESITAIVCGSSDTNKDLKDINGITVNDVNQKIDEELTERGFNKPNILSSAVPNLGDDMVINGVYVTFTGWTPNDS